MKIFIFLIPPIRGDYSYNSVEYKNYIFQNEGKLEKISKIYKMIIINNVYRKGVREMVKQFTIFLPSFSKNQFHSKFLWTLTLLDRPNFQSKLFFTCKYVELKNFIINGFLYEKLIFDFHNGKIHMYISNVSEEALQTILHSLTINSSPTSRLLCLLPGKKPKAEQ